MDDLDDYDADPSWSPPKTPLTPKTRGFKIEKIVLKSMKTTCCGAKIIPARANQRKIDGRCSKCNKGVQIKTSNQKIGLERVGVTKPSLLSTCKGSPVSIYKFFVCDTGVCAKRSRVFSPNHCTKIATYYSHVKDNPWGQPILEATIDTNIKNMSMDIVEKINKKLYF